MERLSDKLACVIEDSRTAWDRNEESVLKSAIDRLAYYENMEEQGRLVVLPYEMLTMSDCYNWSCPFHPKGYPTDCPFSGLCAGYQGEEVTVYYSNSTEPKEGADHVE